MAQTSSHRWQFSRSGGFDQAQVNSAADYANLEHLDQKLWAALACPVKGLEFDERTLSLIDADGDGRVRAPEVIGAVKWCREVMKDVGALRNGGDSVPLAQINDQTDAGKAVLAAAKRILKDLGKADATAISLADAADTAKLFAQTNFNGDGIVPADAAADPSVKAVIENVVACLGGVPDRSGKPGVDPAKVDAFFAQLAAHEAWVKQGETDAALRPLGDATGAALDAVRAVRAKVDDYFARCRLAAFDARAMSAVNRQEAEYLAIAAQDLSSSAKEIAGFPLSHVEPGRPLSLLQGVNPAWADAVAALHAKAVAPILGAGQTTLTPEQWAAVQAKLAAYEAWLASKPATSVEGLGIARVREILAGASKDAVAGLIAQDKALEAEFQAIGKVEQLVRYQRDLHRLLVNFVNFSDFYSRERPAVFQAGRLFLDGRECALCVRVADAGKHGVLAAMSKAYLAYCDCTRTSGEKMQIAAAFTGGDSDYLMVGRNGIFYDRQGRDWDATIVKVVENPISIRQAFWAPYKKLVRLIEEQVAKRAAAAEAASDAKLAAAAAATAHADKAATAAPAPEPKKIDVGTVAALGVAFGAIGTLLATLLGYATGLFHLPFWIVVLALAGLLLLISGPSMLIAWLKLRQRNLGPILDANGWAVNGRVKLNVPFGASLTSVAALPAGAVPAADPFGEKRSAWPGLIKAVVGVCFVFSLINHFGLVHSGLAAAGMKDLPGLVRKPQGLKDDIANALATKDANKDQQVARGEFPGTDAEFGRLDTNGDGTVSAVDAKDSSDEEKPAAEEKK